MKTGVAAEKWEISRLGGSGAKDEGTKLPPAGDDEETTQIAVGGGMATASEVNGCLGGTPEAARMWHPDSQKGSTGRVLAWDECGQASGQDMQNIA